MIKIFNKTENIVEETNFSHMLEVFEFLKSLDSWKNDVLIIYHQDKDGNKTDLLQIEDWGSTVGGLDFYMKKFWKIKEV